jgi:RHS repeat-associated protein
MDRFIYNYHTLNGEQSNRLNYVVDNGIDYSSYDDIKSGQTSGNYTYNKIGELVSDNSENMILHWRTGDHKLARIERTDENSPELEFVYSPFGQRVMKIEKIRANGVFTGEVKNSFYAYDANSLSRCIHSSLTLFRLSNVTIGRQVMAIYSWNFQGNSEQIKLSEQHLYGADRLGMINRDVVVYDNGVTSYTHKETNIVHVDERGRKTFELTNHLGNVLATINDRKLYNELDGNCESVIKSFSDYYTFGMLMPNRQGGSHGRYLFNGMEHDGEVSGTGNSYTTEFRQYDPRLGRWKSLDALMHMFPHVSPYVAFANNPVYFTDIYGLAPDGGDDDGGNGNGEFTINTDKKEIQLYERPTVIATGGKGEPGVGADMGFGKKPMGSIQRDLNNIGLQSEIYQRYSKSDKELFDDLHKLGRDFADGEQARKMIEKIVNHFESNTGTPYQSEDLTEAAANHPSTKRFMNQIGQAFGEEIKSRGGFSHDFSIEVRLKEQKAGHPRFNELGYLGNGDEDNGLKFAVNDVHSYKIRVVNYIEIQGKYFAQIELVLYDHFGLDAGDITDPGVSNTMLRAFYKEFISWYILQWGKGYKPFITVMPIVFHIGGDVK